MAMVIENPVNFKPLLYGLGGVVVLFIITLLFPIYVDETKNNESTRAFRWNAPSRPLARKIDSMTPSEIQQWENDPNLKHLWEAIKNAPASKPLDSYLMGEFFGVGFNWIGWLTLLAFIGLLGFAAFQGYVIYKMQTDGTRKPKKKRDLPLMVRRRGEKKRYGTYGS